MAPRASSTTRKPRGYCWSVAPTLMTASPFTTPSRPPDTMCLRILLEHGATVRETNALGNAIRNPEKVRLLLEHGTCARKTTSYVSGSCTPARTRSRGLLLAHGADPLVRDEDGLTPYDIAARRADESLMAILEDAGAGPTARPSRGVDRRCRTTAARTARPRPAPCAAATASCSPMMASAGNDERVARLLEAGVPIDSPGLEGAAIHYACMWGARQHTAAAARPRRGSPAPHRSRSPARLRRMGLGRAGSRRSPCRRLPRVRRDPPRPRRPRPAGIRRHGLRRGSRAHRGTPMRPGGSRSSDEQRLFKGGAPGWRATLGVHLAPIARRQNAPAGGDAHGVGDIESGVLVVRDLEDGRVVWGSAKW